MPEVIGALAPVTVPPEAVTAALLHDIADAKFHHGDHSVGPKKSRQFLKKFGVDKKTIENVAEIVGNVSFSKTGRRKSGWLGEPVRC